MFFRIQLYLMQENKMMVIAGLFIFRCIEFDTDLKAAFFNSAESGAGAVRQQNWQWHGNAKPF